METTIFQQMLNMYDEDIAHIFAKIKTVHGVANKTNLLAINASIETIHAMDLLESFEAIVAQNLLMQARILSVIISHDPDLLMENGIDFAKKDGIEEIFITDEEGIIRFTNISGSLNNSLKSNEVLHILNNSSLEVILPATDDQFDSEYFKVVAVGRQDQKGIIQLGSRFSKPKGQMAINGFGVVAQEAKRLADVSKDISERITHLTDGMGEDIEDLLKKTEAAAQDVEAEKVEEICELLTQLRLTFREIASPLSELINIARQTNLLGVRAAIEAAHSTNDKQDFDLLLNKHMLIEAKLVASYIEIMDVVNGEGLESIENFCGHVGIGEIWVTDEFGRVEITNMQGGEGFVFKNEGQTAPYMGILNNPDLEVTAPPTSRSLDNKVFKYAGVARKGRKGIVQLGSPSRLYGQSTAEGFSVVAKQIKSLSEQSQETTKEIEEMIQRMDGKTVKAINQLKVFLKQLNA